MFVPDYLPVPQGDHPAGPVDHPLVDNWQFDPSSVSLRLLRLRLDPNASPTTVLAARLGAEEELSDADLEAELRALTEETRRRFENEDVTEDDVAEAIEWARSE